MPREQLDNTVDEAFKSQSKSIDGQRMKTIGKKFKECHKYGKIGHLK